jgi:hypothetical protein
LTRIARVESLLRLAATFQNGSGAGRGTGVEARMLILKDPTDRGTPLGEGGRTLATLRDGNLFSFEVLNRAPAPVDVSILFIRSDYGIDVYYPEPGLQLDNRLPPSRSLRTPPAELSAETVGLEHMILIAVASRAQGQPVDFADLRQPGLNERRRAVEARAINQALARLFPGGLRAMRRIDVEQIEFRVFNWRTTRREDAAR